MCRIGSLSLILDLDTDEAIFIVSSYMFFLVDRFVHLYRFTMFDKSLKKSHFTKSVIFSIILRR